MTLSPPSLKWRIVVLLLAVSLLPLGLVAFGAWAVFGRMIEQRALDFQQNVVQNHARAIDSYLEHRIQLLQLVSATYSTREITEEDSLAKTLAGLNLASDGGFVDLGIINATGDHVAYTGPFRLKGRNYRSEKWFREVVTKGVFVSDVFLGFRRVPHCIIAVKSIDNAVPWILRATINSDQFDTLVKTKTLGENGDSFILNREGRYQTSPRNGSILEQAMAIEIKPHRGVLSRKIIRGGSQQIQMTIWLNQNRWVLVALQESAEVRSPVTRAISLGGLVVLLAVLLVVATTLLATNHLTRRIDKANAQRESMFGAFMRSAKLASVGELATGLAHEINNPLAIISVEETNLRDLINTLDESSEDRPEMLSSLNSIKHQIKRCANITTKMLQFGRKSETKLEPTEIGPRLKEIVELLQRQASVRNVELILEVEKDLPLAVADPLELEQVLVNLINNSFYALPDGGRVTITCKRSEANLQIEVEDNGTGIPKEILDRVFEPFFTTKPAGKGTGLGLAVCYGIVRSWGGRIEAISEPGKGTTIRILLSLPESELPSD